MDAMVLTETDVEDALTTDRKSTRSQRIEVITRGERRRSWSLDQKREGLTGNGIAMKMLRGANRCYAQSGG